MMAGHDGDVSADNQGDGRPRRNDKGHPLITGVVSGLIVAILAPVLLNWWHKDKWTIVDYGVVKNPASPKNGLMPTHSQANFGAIPVLAPRAGYTET